MLYTLKRKMERKPEKKPEDLIILGSPIRAIIGNKYNQYKYIILNLI